MATTVSHEIRESGTALYVERVSASKAATPATGADRAAEAVQRLEEMAADVRGCALLDAGGAVLASSGDAERRDDWAEAAAGLLAAADAIRDQPAEHVHVGTEEGEVFAVRDGGLAMVAVTDRFTLTSLLVSDMRTVLREALKGSA
jgi:predicted regulator of Ras-like GTPase activity (Roadblock/LC7/MglB family)